MYMCLNVPYISTLREESMHLKLILGSWVTAVIEYLFTEAVSCIHDSSVYS